MKCKIGSKVRIISYEAMMNSPQLNLTNKDLRSDDPRLGVVLKVDSYFDMLITCNNGTTYPNLTIEEVVEE